MSYFRDIVQTSSHYGQQHQLPFNLGGALPRASFGQYQGPAMGNQQQPHLPGQGFSYPSAGSQANAHLFADSQHFRSQQPAGSQAYGSNDLASQMLLQRLQQQSYSQVPAPQGGAGLDRFFNPSAFSNAQNARVPAIPVRVANVSDTHAAAHVHLLGLLLSCTNAPRNYKMMSILDGKTNDFVLDLHLLYACRTCKEACQSWKQ